MYSFKFSISNIVPIVSFVYDRFNNIQAHTNEMNQKIIADWDQMKSQIMGLNLSSIFYYMYRE